MEPVDIGGGFTMEEVTEPEGEPSDVKAVRLRLAGETTIDARNTHRRSSYPIS